MHNIKQGLSQKYYMGTAPFEELQKTMLDLFYLYPNDMERLDMLSKTVRNYLSKAEIAKHEHPNNAKEIDKYVKWLKNDYAKLINKDAKKFGMQFTF